jgi:hypothetical protein
MTIFKSLLVGLGACTLALSCAAATQEIHGVKIPDSVTVSGTTLQLNGAGTRYKYAFKIYVADLYTTKKVHSLEELVAAPGPKRMNLTMLRETEAGPFGKLLTRGVEDNVPKNEMSKLVPGLIKMGEIFYANKVLNPGEVITLDWIPGTGMVVTVKGKVQAEPFPEPAFFKAIMSIWFGPVPGDFQLKEALLDTK